MVSNDRLSSTVVQVDADPASLPVSRQLHRVFVVLLAAYHCIEIFRYAAVPANGE